MSVFTISTLNYEPELRENLLNELNYLGREGVKINLSEKTSGKILFLNCAMEEAGEDNKGFTEKIFRNYLANMITDLMMNQLTKGWIQRILKTKYQCFDEADTTCITQTAYASLNSLHSPKDMEITLARHNRVFNEVHQYLDQNTDLYLEGFLRFRLKDYFQEVEESIEKAVDTFLMEKEYKEFIRLLRYFVEAQEPKIDEVHVRIQSKDEIYFLDEANQPIMPEQIHSVSRDNQEIDYEDWLLGALITLAPRKILLHLSAEVELTQTIISVFQQRVEIREGCEFCQKSQPVTCQPK